MSPKFKVGDLVMLNDFGRLVVDENKNRVGLIVSGATNMLYPLLSQPDHEPFSYWAYDLMMGEELLTDVPQEFLQPFDDEEEE